MGISAGLQWLFGTAAAAAPEAAAAVAPEVIAAGSAAVDPALLESIGAGTFEYAAPTATGLAAAAAPEIAAAAAPAATDLSYLPIGYSATGAPVGADLAALTGTPADFAATAPSIGSLAPTTATSALTPGAGALTGGVGTAAGSALPAGLAAPLSDITAAASPELTGTASQFAAAAPATTAVTVPEVAPSVAEIASTGTAPVLSDATSAAEQTFGLPGQQVASKLGGGAQPIGSSITNTAVTEAPAATAGAPAATAGAPAASATPAASAASATPAAPAAPAASVTSTIAPPPAGGFSFAPVEGEVIGGTGLTNLTGTASQYASGLSDAAANAGASSNLLGDVGSYLMKNPGLALSGLGLAYNMLRPQQKPEFQPNLESAAAQQTARGEQLQNYLTSGTLPPGIQTSLNSAANAAAATIRSQYAARGMSGSSAEAQDLQRVSDTIVSQGASIASSLYNMGVTQENMANQIYTNLMNASLAQDTALSNSIAGFTNALAGGYARSATPVG